MAFYYHNPNPKGLHTNDCVIRAFSFFFGVTWEDAFMDLIRWCIDQGEATFNYRSVYNRYLLEHKGLKRHSAPERGITVNEFCERFAENGAVYIISTHRHLTIVLDKDIIDTFDCGNFKVDGYWKKNDSTK